MFDEIGLLYFTFSDNWISKYLANINILINGYI